MKLKKLFLSVLIIISSLVICNINANEGSLNTDIKIVSYNIHSGVDKDMFPTLFDIIDFLKNCDADIICLQEVNESAKVGFQVSSLKEELGMNAHFGANVVNLNSNYGLVTYSKYRIIRQNHVYLSSSKEQRGMLHTVIDVRGKPVNIINVHLGTDKDEQVGQLREVQEFVDKLGDEPYIIAGDFNAADINLDSNCIDVAKKLDKSNTLTFSLGIERIDYIFVSQDIVPINYRVIIKKLSDHYPIIAKLRI
ncbi:MULTISPECIES: endonuclease/exonuclease/phosphatase family protein [Terrisporobacter]|uniref:Endonuclease/exonuclease/phosphatase family protein n=1 Tax=Terrisporobacter muris TaxID=2963284 RepID=A0A9X2S2T9_9FIRM|nr:endonuclease/exonuclease/phosphatase family protein [Terrisporobacter othiniensis]MCR1824413.1 endonuclease/exonuclease/phosphatase family protein [Terrisporobacter muris]MDY3372039.1 endonuclease/exonuclease/phosphatase family protein [Terrisporobacter othiniensis]